MKKIFLLVVLTLTAFSFNSCSSSSDDTNPVIGGTISFKVDGVQKTFDNIYVSENVINPGTADEFTDLGVYSMPQNTSEHIEFFTEKNHMEDIVSVFYTADGVQWTRLPGVFTVHLTSNGNNNKLVGTFAGQMGDDEIQPQNFINITEGTFNIQY
ncbi:hypothetical protein [Flavobacterium wongokense]|uniref:hypothetical protein n=1 Tax=Flavobacterium wongokense TaxID=2910674 RepID=UPI001F31DC28|nr:hypothetical protein [Flavobacterium sp. WG47]MCF6133020.1 hypothetical protein [Flavobacterium sp. WG47]